MFENFLAKKHIQHLDFSAVRAKLEEKLGWSRSQALNVESDYKRFLYALAHRKPGDVLSPPTQEVDEFWHQHILYTKKYRQDCDTVFGHYVDHTPELDAETQKKADMRRREVYQRFNIDSISFPDHSDLAASSRGSFIDVFGSDHSCDSKDGGGCDSGGGGDGGGGCGGGGCGGGCGGS